MPDESSRATHVALSIDNQLLAPNGNCFFPGAFTHIAVYDHRTEKVIQLPQVGDPTKHKNFYTHVFSHDGRKLYCGTETTKRDFLPIICEIDTTVDPSEIRPRVIGPVGSTRNSFSYAYELQIDLPWLYVVVGQNPWELCALNVHTAEMKVLRVNVDEEDEERKKTKGISLGLHPEGNPKGIVAHFGQAKRGVPDQWLKGGALDKDWIRDADAPPFAHDVKPFKDRLALLTARWIDDRPPFGAFRVNTRKLQNDPHEAGTTVNIRFRTSNLV